MRVRNLILFVSLSCVFGVQLAHAQALPVASFAINRAEAAIISRVAIARGFAANDPRIAATLTGMGEASTALNVVSTGASVALGFAGAPVWLTVAAGVGILAAGSYLYANGGQLSFSRSSDGKVITVQQPMPVSASAGYSPISGSSSDSFASIMYSLSGSGVPVYHTSSCLSTSPCAAFPAEPASGNKNFYWSTNGYSIVAGSLAQVQQAEQVMASYPPSNNVQGASASVFFTPNADGTAYTLQETVTKGICTVFGGADGNTCVSGEYNYVTTNLAKAGLDAYWTVGTGASPVGGTDLSQIYPQLSSSALATPLDPSTLMQLTNQTWQQAASQPDYQGLPYSVTNPVQYSDVQSWAQANPSSVPDIGDLFTPAANPGTAVVISPTIAPGSTGDTGASSPSAASSTDVNVVNTPNVNVTNKVSVDLGADPGIGTPTMESTPTISMILSPLLGMLPDLRSWSVPVHTSACPEPSFTVLGQSFTMTAQCDLAESHRQAIYTAFAAMFTLAAVLIVLRA